MYFSSLNYLLPFPKKISLETKNQILCHRRTKKVIVTEKIRSKNREFFTEFA